ncbi:unnamed protein product [Notodromas monacha]|uniref:CNH domain-containing protein n=1 Tax=Notodromas monacha TaxID=399045 RepID=A0A7R9GB33_9CRUS|nr:unnamed protein product [Notodromas monacha]CAG0914615.1 unnamed protein product [Notodromas monacha]
MNLKAFDLKSVLSITALNQLGIQGEICCVEVSGSDLFVGTTAGFIFGGLCSESPSPTTPSEVDVRVKRKCHKQLNTKKGVTAMESSSAISKLLAVSDGCLYMLSTVDLEIYCDGSPLLKNVHGICVNHCASTENPFEIQVCLARKKTLDVCLISDEGVKVLREIGTGPSRSLHRLSMAGDFVVAAYSTGYVSYDWRKGHSVTLITYNDAELPRPYVCWVQNDEFMISAPGGLGVFVKAMGVSEKPPIVWLNDVVAAAYIKPYVVAADEKSMAVYGSSDQQRKQIVSVHGAKGLKVFEGRLFLWSESSVYNLPSIGWRDQVLSLLEVAMIEDGLKLAQEYEDACQPEDLEFFHRFAGFVCVSKGDLETAKSHFGNCDLDPRVLLRLFGDLSAGFFEEIANDIPCSYESLTTLCGSDEERKNQLRDFTMEFSLRALETGRSSSHEVVVGVFKLLTEKEKTEELINFVSRWHIELEKDRNLCLQWLDSRNLPEILALFQTCLGDHASALPLWKELLKSGIPHVHQDDILSQLVNILNRLSNDSCVIWNYAALIFEINPDKGLEMLLTFSESSESLTSCDDVVDFLEKFPDQRISFLENIVMAKKSTKEKYHTQLTKAYLEAVLRERKEKSNAKVAELREKLQDFLIRSDEYRVHLMLNLFRTSDLSEEQAIVHGKLEDHVEALKIFVHQLRNHDGAIKYCLRMSERKSKGYRQKLFLLLLKLHLDPAIDDTLRAELKPRTLQLLREHRAEYLDSAAEVLGLLPKDWPVSAAASLFLWSSVRYNVHRKRVLQLQASLSRAVLLHNQYARYLLCKDPVLLKRDRFCCICQKPFVQASFARYPNGVETHVECARNHNVCPISGKVFRVSSRAVQ